MEKPQGIVLRGTEKHRHDVFKLKVAKGKRNISWKHKKPQLEDVEHCHFWHSLDCDTFQDNKYCQPVAGHFHEVEVVWENDKDGQPFIKTVKCGPALERKEVYDGEDAFIENVPVEWEADPKKYKATSIVDAHTHELEYRGSEVITAHSTNLSRQAEREKVSRATTPMPAGVEGAAQASKAQSMQDNAQKVQHVVKER